MLFLQSRGRDRPSTCVEQHRLRGEGPRRADCLLEPTCRQSGSFLPDGRGASVDVSPIENGGRVQRQSHRPRTTPMALIRATRLKSVPHAAVSCLLFRGHLHVSSEHSIGRVVRARGTAASNIFLVFGGRAHDPAGSSALKLGVDAVVQRLPCARGSLARLPRPHAQLVPGLTRQPRPPIRIERVAGRRACIPAVSALGAACAAAWSRRPEATASSSALVRVRHILPAGCRRIACGARKAGEFGSVHLPTPDCGRDGPYHGSPRFSGSFLRT